MASGEVFRETNLPQEIVMNTAMNAKKTKYDRGLLKSL